MVLPMAEDKKNQHSKSNDERDERSVPNSFMPYPVSRLSPKIVPSSSSSFKNHGIRQIQKQAASKMEELKEQYEQIVDEFNWNKLVYESHFNFEPVIGEIYHLYEDGKRVILSMIEPEQWPKKRFIASVKLGVGGKWKLEKKAEGFDLKAFLTGEHPSPEEGEEIHDI